MRVQVKYFATLHDRAGLREEIVELPEGATIGDLKRRIIERHARLDQALDTALTSVNQEYASPEDGLNDGDEVAFFPPVSGGKDDDPPGFFDVTDDELDMNALLQRLVTPATGAACVFTGVVRARTEKGEPRVTDHLEYEAYKPMAEAKLQQVANEIRDQWPAVVGVGIVQRIGHLEPGSPTVLVACTAAHRDSGVFEAARYGIDRLKEIVPVWKKEVGPDGASWVEGDYRPTGKDRSADIG